MSKQKTSTPKLVIEETFAAADDRFVESFRSNHSAKYLASFLEKWLKDARPWSRKQLQDYLGLAWTPLGHDVVYKRIFKHFYAENDHEMMGVLMPQLDRLVRRRRVKRWHYDRKTRQSWTTESLYAATNKVNNWQYGRQAELNRLFSHRTRNYLRRAAWRYFRVLSHHQPEVYVQQIAQALARYEDHDFQDGENILDNWSLMHACFYHHDAIQFTAAHSNLAQEATLADLSPAPYQAEAWKSNAAAEALLGLLVDANSTFVRIWAVELFLQNFKESVGQIGLRKLIHMMASPDVRLQNFATEAFESHPDLPTLNVEQWLALLDEAGVGQLPRICEAMKKHVALERLDTDQLIQLTCAKQVPVAMMGFEFAQTRDIDRPFSTSELSRFAESQCAQQASAISTFALTRIGQLNEDALPDQVIGFFDSLLKPTRAAAMQWLSESDSPGYGRAKLWSMLVETPFDDVKLPMVELLHRRCQHADGETDRWAPVWVAVILGVNRGGRTKPKALDQLAAAIIRDPQTSADLLPVVALAIRSIRNTELRSGLASLAKILDAHPELSSEIQQAIPELEFAATEEV